MTTLTGPRVGLRLAAGRAAVRFAAAGAVYGLAAVGYQRESGRAGQPPLAGVIGVTAVVAVLLWLLSARIDRLSARMLLGGQADGYQVMRALTRQLAGALPVDEVAPRVAQAAWRATGQSRAEVRLRLPGGQPWARSWPPASTPMAGGVTVGVQHSGATVGEIAVEVGDRSPENLPLWDRRLLDDLARPAGPALSTVRLTVELRQRRAELERLTIALQASRDRLLASRAVEQSRMRAEVAARVSPHLIAALTAVSADQGDAIVTAGAEGRCTSEAFEIAGTEAAAALDELRIIARGIFPPTLSEVGLAASLESWLVRAKATATIEVPEKQPTLGERPDLQACLYFCAVTSVAHLAAHDAHEIRLAVADGPPLTLCVAAEVTEAGAREVVEAVTDRIEAAGGDVDYDLSSGRFALTATILRPLIPDAASVTS